MDLNPLHLFVSQKITELCFSRSLDSYRAKYLNPKTALLELYHLSNDWNSNKVKDYNSIVTCSLEVTELIKKESYIKFGNLSKEKFITDLGNLSKKKGEKGFKVSDSFQYELFYLVNNNQDYLENLFNQIEKITFEPLDGEIGNRTETMIQLDSIISFCITEIVHRGFSKSYIYKLNRALFVYNESISFEEKWRIFRDKFTISKNVEYVVGFSFTGKKKQLKEIRLTEIIEDPKQKLEPDIISKLSKKLLNYIEPVQNKRFLIIKVEALDYYQALKKGKHYLATVLDKLHIGYSNFGITLWDTAMVIDLSDPTKGDLQPTHYQLDGYYKTKKDRFDSFLDEINKIESNPQISVEVKERINSAIRQLRLGNEAIELEKKFINYWIGLEYMFSNYNKDKSTFKRILEFLPKLHTVYYAKRNVVNFYENLTQFLGKEAVQNLEELYSDESYNNLITSKFEQHPLMSYRASRLKSYLFSASDKRMNYLGSHRTRLEWHLVRLYRVRNELIHDASTKEELENLTGNLRYYLNFTLNKSIEFFSSECKEEVLRKELIMDDFFSHHLMVHEKIFANKAEKEVLFEQKFDLEFLR